MKDNLCMLYPLVCLVIKYVTKAVEVQIGETFFYDPTINTVAAKSFSAYFIKWINNVDFFE